MLSSQLCVLVNEPGVWWANQEMVLTKILAFLTSFIHVQIQPTIRVWLRVSIALDSTQVQFPAPVSGAYDCLKIQLLGGIQDLLPGSSVIKAHVQIPPRPTHTRT